jgi:hypothetical protein
LFNSRSAKDIDSNYTFNFLPDLGHYSSDILTDMGWPGLLDSSAADLDLQYCLAQDFMPSCKVGLSNMLLLVIVICTSIKAILCSLVLWILSGEQPLVVPGDAIASFISRPDMVTAGKCTLDKKFEKKLPIGTYCAWLNAPAQWHSEGRRHWASAISGFIWTYSYIIFIFDLIFVAVMFEIAQKTTPVSSR